jgi:hypothetical protein
VELARAPLVTNKIFFVFLSTKLAVLSSLDQFCVSNCVIEPIQATGGRNFFHEVRILASPVLKYPAVSYIRIDCQLLFQFSKVWSQQHLERTLK